MDLTSDFKIIKFDNDIFTEIEDQVVKEFPLKIVFNEQELVTLVCSPNYLDELAVGYLFSEGLITHSSDIAKINLENERLTVQAQKISTVITNPIAHQVITSGCGRSKIYADLYGSGLKKVYSQVSVTTEQVYYLAAELNKRSDLFRQTGGVHNSLLVDNQGDLFIFREDIGRHNAIDKLVGYLTLNQISPENKIFVTTGRISAEILLKTARRSIPILISRSAPTDLAINLAYRLGITIVGFARGKRMNVYTHQERIKDKR